MGAISNIYDGLITLIEANTTNYVRLADAYDIENNDILRIEKGYSLGFLVGSNTNRYLTGDKLTLERSFNLTFTNLYTAIETDPTTRATIEKQFMEDAYDVWKALEVVSHLGGTQVANARYNSDDGIQYLFDENIKAITIVSEISVEYFE